MWFKKILDFFNSEKKLRDSQFETEKWKMKYSKLAEEYATLSKDWDKLYNKHLGSIVKETELFAENVELHNKLFDNAMSYEEFKTERGISVTKQIEDIIEYAEHYRNPTFDIYAVGNIVLRLGKDYITDEKYSELHNRLMKFSIKDSTSMLEYIEDSIEIKEKEENREILENLIFDEKKFNNQKRLYQLKDLIEECFVTDDSEFVQEDCKKINPQKMNQFFCLYAAFYSLKLLSDDCVKKFVQQLALWFPKWVDEKNKTKIIKAIYDEKGKWKQKNTLLPCMEWQNFINRQENKDSKRNNFRRITNEIYTKVNQFVKTLKQ